MFSIFLLCKMHLNAQDAKHLIVNGLRHIARLCWSLQQKFTNKQIVEKLNGIPTNCEKQRNYVKAATSSMVSRSALCSHFGGAVWLWMTLPGKMLLILIWQNVSIRVQVLIAFVYFISIKSINLHKKAVLVKVFIFDTLCCTQRCWYDCYVSTLWSASVLMFVYYQYVYALKFHVNPLTFVHAVSQLYRNVSEPLVVEWNSNSTLLSMLELWQCCD